MEMSDAGISKAPWTKEEDDILRNVVGERGPTRWNRIADVLPHRTGKQCRERWYNHLAPGLVHEPWHWEEDQMIVDLHAIHGNAWSTISKYIPGRTANSIKNRWNATLRRLTEQEIIRPLINVENALQMLESGASRMGLLLPSASEENFLESLQTQQELITDPTSATSPASPKSSKQHSSVVFAVPDEGTDESREKFSDSSVTDRRRFYSDTIDVKGESPTSSVKKRQSYKSYRIQLEELGSSESNSKENQSLSPSCNENSLCPLKIDVQCPESFDMVTFLNQITSTPAIELMQPPMLTPLLANTSPTPIDPSTPLSSLISSFQRKRSKSSSKDRPLSFGSLPPDYDEMSFVTTSAGSVPLQDYLKRNVPFSESMSSSSFPSCESDSAALSLPMSEAYAFDPRTPATSVSHIPVTSTMSTSVSVSSSISTPEGNEDALAASHLLDISSYPPSSQINSLDHPFASRSSNLKSSGEAEAESNTESLLLTKDVEK